jgi:hypothetical protein
MAPSPSSKPAARANSSSFPLSYSLTSLIPLRIHPHEPIPPGATGSALEGNLAAHSGGSCQASLSFDNGTTWKVLHSFIGGCPAGTKLNSNMVDPKASQVFEFNIPEGTKSGESLFAWYITPLFPTITSPAEEELLGHGPPPLVTVVSSI